MDASYRATSEQVKRLREEASDPGPIQAHREGREMWEKRSLMLSEAATNLAIAQEQWNNWAKRANRAEAALREVKKLIAQGMDTDERAFGKAYDVARSALEQVKPW